MLPPAPGSPAGSRPRPATLAGSHGFFASHATAAAAGGGVSRPGYGPGVPTPSSHAGLPGRAEAGPRAVAAAAPASSSSASSLDAPVAPDAPSPTEAETASDAASAPPADAEPHLSSSRGSPVGVTDTVTIHVCDEAKGVTRDFVCSRALLLREMQYFADHLSASDAPDDVDISVHCDVGIFEWLMAFVQRAPGSDGPTLTVPAAVSVLISSHFLRMLPLVDRCLSFIAAHAADVARLPIDLSCVTDPLVARLAPRLSPRALEGLHAADPKGRLAPRVFRARAQALLRSHGPPARCAACAALFSPAQHAVLPCPRARPFVDFHGAQASRHPRAQGWSVARYLRRLRARGAPWRALYWTLYGVAHHGRCRRCRVTFQACALDGCARHNEPAVGSPPRHRCCSGSPGSPGCTPCAHDPEPGPDGEPPEWASLPRALRPLIAPTRAGVLHPDAGAGAPGGGDTATGGGGGGGGASDTGTDDDVGADAAARGATPFARVAVGSTYIVMAADAPPPSGVSGDALAWARPASAAAASTAAAVAAHRSRPVACVWARSRADVVAMDREAAAARRPRRDTAPSTPRRRRAWRMELLREEDASRVEALLHDLRRLADRERRRPRRRRPAGGDADTDGAQEDASSAASSSAPSEPASPTRVRAVARVPGAAKSGAGARRRPASAAPRANQPRTASSLGKGRLYMQVTATAAGRTPAPSAPESSRGVSATRRFR